MRYNEKYLKNAFAATENVKHDWLKTIPCMVRSEAVRDLCEAFWSNMAKRKKNPRHTFTMRFKSKKNKSQTTLISFHTAGAHSAHGDDFFCSESCYYYRSHNVGHIVGAPASFKPQKKSLGASHMTDAAASDLKKRGFSLFVAIPAYGCKMTANTATSLLRLQGHLAQLGIPHHTEMLGNESLITRGRNILVGHFLKSPASHLLFIDADIAFNPETVIRLAVADKDIVGAVYPKKSIDWGAVQKKVQEKAADPEQHAAEPTTAMGLDFNINAIHSIDDQGFAEVLDTATGFLMISRTCLEKLSEEYADLTCVNDIAGSRQVVPEYVALFDCIKCPDSRRYLSEDYAFCRRAQKAGFKIYADLASSLGHTGSYVYSGDVSQRYAMSLTCAD